MADRPEPMLSPNALTVLERRYLNRDNHGRATEKPRDLFWRVARFVADADAAYGSDATQIEETAAEFFDLMARLEFLPNSPTLMNAGRSLGQLSACFVLPVGDSMEEIFEANKQAALIHKSGGGTGFSFSRLRPRNSVVASTKGVASGPVSFMKVFNAATEAVKQGGTRRGANMAVLRVDHPDILEFISCKSDTSEMTNFNISVGLTDIFMTAVANDTNYDLFNPHTAAVYMSEGKPVSMRAREVFDLIVDQAWQTGEPGVIFLDRMNETNPTFPDEVIEATNPCGEQPLPPYDSCNLGSINLSRFAFSPLPANYSNGRPEAGIDWTRLAGTISRSIHFLDNVIDQNRYPLPEIEAQTVRNRRIGLGVMGWADLLVKLRLPYNSEAAFELGERVMEFLSSEAHKKSSRLAKTRGRFPSWDKSRHARDNIAMRNATVTTVAPTGTISIIAGCSSGIEPYYAIAYERNVLDGTRLVELNPLFEKTARREGFFSEKLVADVSGTRSLADLPEVPDHVKAVFLTAADINPEDHVRMQAAFQKHTDSSVSKTINFPTSADRESIRTAFLQAYDSGCKGLTVYRDESRPDQVLSIPGATESAPQVAARPDTLKGVTEKIRTGYGNLYVTVNFRDEKPFEVFAQIGRSGYTTMADTEAICRLISMALRSGVSAASVVRQLRGIGGSNQVFSSGTKVTSIPDAIAQVLARHVDTNSTEVSRETPQHEICPDCTGAMIFASGCYNCPSCGYSSC
jgi:ribonucleoside-diphosphate reductase alpha chain